MPDKPSIEHLFQYIMNLIENATVYIAQFFKSKFVLSLLIPVFVRIPNWKRQWGIKLSSVVGNRKGRFCQASVREKHAKQQKQKLSKNKF